MCVDRLLAQAEAVAAEAAAEAEAQSAQAEALKAEGNTCFKAKDYEGALAKWTARLHPSTHPPISPIRPMLNHSRRCVRA